MTISSTSNFELTISQLCQRAMQLAGLYEAGQTPSETDMSMARDFLGLELGAMQAEGLMAHTVERTTLDLVSGTAEYTLPSDCIDVLVGPDNFAGTIVPTDGAETHVRVVTRHEYQNFPIKDTAATPTHVYIERGLTTKVVFWPVPNDSTLDFRYEKVRLVRDSSDGSKTPDVQRRRQKALMWTLAHDLAVAKSKPLDLVKYLRDSAEDLKRKAKADDVERGHSQFYVERRR